MSEVGEGPMFWSVIVPPGRVLHGRQNSTPWPQHLGISDQLLRYADPDQVQQGDGFVRFNMLNDDSVLYGIAHADPNREGINHYDRIDA